MRLLSLWQPWAQAMAIGWKTIETRSWSTEYRGEVLIHAAKNFPAEAREMASSPLARGIGNLPRGVIVCTGQLVDCIPTTAVCRIDAAMSVRRHTNANEWEWGNYAPGRFAWIFERIRPLAPPVWCRGTQGLRPVTAEVLRAVDLSLKG